MFTIAMYLSAVAVGCLAAKSAAHTRVFGDGTFGRAGVLMAAGVPLLFVLVAGFGVGQTVGTLATFALMGAMFVAVAMGTRTCREPGEVISAGAMGTRTCREPGEVISAGASCTTDHLAKDAMMLAGFALFAFAGTLLYGLPST